MSSLAGKGSRPGNGANDFSARAAPTELSILRTQVVKVLKSMRVPDADADDVAQQVLEELSHTLEGPTHPRADPRFTIWVAIRRWRTARRDAADRRTRESAAAKHNAGLAADQERLIIARDVIALWRRCVERLPAKQRAVVLACIVGGLSHTEAAAELRLPVGTVKSCLRAGIALVSEMMQAEISEGDKQW